MITTEELAEHRADAESRMGAANGGSDATVRRFLANTAKNPLSGLREPEFTEVHSGPMRLSARTGGSGESRAVKVPGGEVAVAVRRADWPASTAPLQDGDVIEITAGDQVGTRWLVVEADRADQQTAYRVPVIRYADS